MTLSYLTGPFLTLPFLEDERVVAGDVGRLLLDVDLVDATESRFDRIFGFETLELTLVILW